MKESEKYNNYSKIKWKMIKKEGNSKDRNFPSEQLGALRERVPVQTL